MSNKIACLCVIDDGSTHLNSYFNWQMMFMHPNNLHESFDVFVASVDEAKFLRSPLYRLLQELHGVGIIGKIFTIQFDISDLKDQDERVLKLSTLCENFREVNQFLHGLSYSFYYQCQINFNPGVKNLKRFAEVFDANVPTDIAFLFKSYRQSNGFFATANRQNFSNLQNFYSFFNAEPTDGFEFVFEKYMVSINLDVFLLLTEEQLHD